MTDDHAELTPHIHRRLTLCHLSVSGVPLSSPVDPFENYLTENGMPHSLENEKSSETLDTTTCGQNLFGDMLAPRAQNIRLDTWTPLIDQILPLRKHPAASSGGDPKITGLYSMA